MMTINEYKELHGLSVRRLAEHLGVSFYAVIKWLEGGRATAKNVELLKGFGIEHPESKARSKADKEKEANSSKKTLEIKKVKFKSKILKEHHVIIIREYGNTIISKRHEADEIIKEFAKFGLKVELSDFKDKTHYDWNTHYVVTLIGSAKRSL